MNSTSAVSHTHATCPICHNHAIPTAAMDHHVQRVHGLAAEPFYMQYVAKIDQRPKCANPRCSKYAVFFNLKVGYMPCCSKACGIVVARLTANRLAKGMAA